MDYIYGRVSTKGQTTDPQELALRERFPQAKVINEIASGAKSRPALFALVEGLEAGDKLIVAALDRLGRRTSEVLSLIEKLDAKGAVLISIREGVDYSTIAGRLVTQILCSVAEMERSVISERTRMGLASVRARGKKLGAPFGNKNRAKKTVFHDDVFQARFRLLSGKLTCREAARELGVSAATVCRLKQRYASKAHSKPASSSSPSKKRSSAKAALASRRISSSR